MDTSLEALFRRGVIVRCETEEEYEHLQKICYSLLPNLESDAFPAYDRTYGYRLQWYQDYCDHTDWIWYCEVGHPQSYPGYVIGTFHELFALDVDTSNLDELL